MLGERIKQARIKKEWTQEFLAFKLKVSKNSVSKWERDKQVPTKEIQKKLERIFKIKLQEEKETTTKKQEKNCIVNIIKQARQAKKLTQKELASKLGISASKVSSWENNKSTPNAEMQAKLYQILGLDCTNLEAVCPNKKEVEQEKETVTQQQDNVKQAKETVTQQQDVISQQQDSLIQKRKYNLDYQKLPLGVSDFEEIRKSNMYYADHTMFITELVTTAGQTSLITRPRRFGKTLTLKMLKCFFEYGQDPNLFNGLEISKYPEICQEYQNQYPVIFLTFKNLDAPNFDDNLTKLRTAIYNMADKFVFLRKSPKLDEDDIQRYNELCQIETMTRNTINNCLYTLTYLLYKHYGQKVIVLIDEYDVPLNKAHHAGYYKKILPIIRDILHKGLKDNDAVEFAVITGCLKIFKESIFTDLNNVTMYSMLSFKFAESFGFTKREVIELLENYNLQDKYQIIKDWYDGYRIGNEEIYCPWDVIQYTAALNKDRESTPIAYWSNTSSNKIIQTLLKNFGKNVRNKISDLLNGGTITTILNENIVYDSLYDSIENLWSILFLTGYLRIENKVWNESESIYQLKIPNKEIRIVFTNFFKEWVIDSYKNGDKKEELEKFCNAIEQGNAEGMENFLNNFLRTTISIKDYSGKKTQKESLYHGILVGLLQPQDERWYCTSNMETGNGYADITLSTQENEIGFILELKYARSDNLEFYCQEAMQQINSKHYIDYFRKNRYSQVLKYAIAFFEKSCKVVIEKENLN